MDVYKIMDKNRSVIVLHPTAVEVSRWDVVQEGRGELGTPNDI